MPSTPKKTVTAKDLTENTESTENTRTIITTITTNRRTTTVKMGTGTSEDGTLRMGMRMASESTGDTNIGRIGNTTVRKRYTRLPWETRNLRIDLPL